LNYGRIVKISSGNRYIAENGTEGARIMAKKRWNSRRRKEE